MNYNKWQDAVTVQLDELLQNMQHRHNREEIDMRQLRVALAGLGSRGKDTYAKTAKLFPEKMKITARVDRYCIMTADSCREAEIHPPV